MRLSQINKSKRRGGFTLVELVVVVLILGVLAAVALPKMAASTTTAKTNAAKQSLNILRNAVEMFRANNDSYPTVAATLPTVLVPYLKGPFPACAIGNLNPTVVAGAADFSVQTGGAGWAYVPSTGDFYINHADGAGF